ncbi:hypothetical protein HK104_004055 [Borealophlyctis nickersoniae]|nr:hypothetical protein HK104_004055 [Borealophlyctis nickersoniae]
MFRELKEETGYTGTLKSMGPPVAYEPGMTASCTRVAWVEIDADAPENRAPTANREADEWSLLSVGIQFDTLYDTLIGGCEGMTRASRLSILSPDLRVLHTSIFARTDLTTKCPALRIDSRLFTFAMGLHLSST